MQNHLAKVLQLGTAPYDTLRKEPRRKAEDCCTYCGDSVPSYWNQITGWYCDTYRCREAGQNDKRRADRQDRKVKAHQAFT